jgi:hypothetical protein
MLLKKLNTISFIIAILCINWSCKKFVDIDSPNNQLVSNTVFTSDASATSALIGVYSNIMRTASSFVNTQTTLLAGLSSDEFSNYSTSSTQTEFYQNALSANNSNVQIYWRDTYKYLYQVNAIIEGLSKSASISNKVKAQLEGEAKFLRAMCHFYLVNFFGDIPLITTTDYRINTMNPRTPASEVYQQIITDLKDAELLLSENYVKGDNTIYSGAPERVRPIKAAATALLARTYLYAGDWNNSELHAKSVIENRGLFNLTTLDSVFLKNSKETIWQLMPVVSGFNTWEGNTFIPVSTPTSIAISSFLYNAFELGDLRLTKWINSITVGAQTYYYPFKYKVRSGATVTEYYTILRLAEQYLIRAEARAQQNNLSGALSDLNIIRARAKLPNSNAIDKASLLSAIEKERRVELFAEIGHRWLDLKRTNRANSVMSVIKGSAWQATDIFYPIPQSEILNNLNLKQNLGY